MKYEQNTGGVQGRSYSYSQYRYGFNNQEKDGELGEYYAFEYRIHDARLGRFLSVDPLSMEYPWNSCYSFAENRVIDGIDLEGMENITVHIKPNQWNAAGTCIHAHINAQNVATSFFVNYYDCNGRLLKSGPATFIEQQQLINGCINASITNLGQNQMLKQYNYQGIVYRDLATNPRALVPDPVTGLINLPPGSGGVTDMYFNGIFNTIHYTERRTIESIKIITRSELLRYDESIIEVPFLGFKYEDEAWPSDGSFSRAEKDEIAKFVSKNEGMKKLHVNRTIMGKFDETVYSGYQIVDANSVKEYAKFGIEYSASYEWNSTSNTKTATIYIPKFALVDYYEITKYTELREMDYTKGCVSTPTGGTSTTTPTVTTTPVISSPKLEIGVKTSEWEIK